jgi:phosphomevalonate kinase
LTVSTSTPGKLILLGEYAVLEGAPAIVTAVDRFAQIELHKKDDDGYYISAPNIGIIDLSFSIENNSSLKFNKNMSESLVNQLLLFEKVFLHIYKTIQKQKITLIPCKITIDTGDFYFNNTNQKIGLGSSAAITVGLVEAFYKFNNLQFKNSQELFNIALQSHFEAQGKIGSGVDIAASTFTGTGIFKKSFQNYTFNSIRLPEDLYMLPIWTGSSTSTPEFVSKTNQLKKQDLSAYNQIMKELIDLSNQGCIYLLENDSIKFLDVVNKYYASLDELGKSAGIPIISKNHKEIAEIVKDLKGFYKPSGAGGNDIGIAFTNDLKIKRNLIEKINNSAFKYIKLETFTKSES